MSAISSNHVRFIQCCLSKTSFSMVRSGFYPRHYLSTSGLESRQPRLDNPTLLQQQRPIQLPPPPPRLRYNDFYDFERHSVDWISKLIIVTLVSFTLLAFTGLPETLIAKIDRYMQGDKGKSGLLKGRAPEP